MESKRNIIIFFISGIIFLLALSILLIVNLTAKKDNEESSRTTTKTSTVIDKTFRGYTTYDISTNDTIILNIEKNYEFIYAGTSTMDIYNEYKGKVYNYTINIVDGELLFRESIEDASLNGYRETGMTYQYRGESKITSLIVCKSNEPSKYAIVVMDEKNNVYLYENSEVEKTISKIISNIKKVKTISKVKRIGYYNYSNMPGMKNNNYELIYEDVNGNIRYLKDKNNLFFDDAYYRYLGSADVDDNVYVFKDGTMRLSSNETVLNNGNNHIYYRGTFYTYDESKLREDLYIIGKDMYLYYIDDLSSSSLPILNRVSTKKIKKIGTQVNRDDNNFATSSYKIIIEFEGGELFKLDKILDFELL